MSQPYMSYTETTQINTSQPIVCFHQSYKLLICCFDLFQKLVTMILELHSSLITTSRFLVSPVALILVVSIFTRISLLSNKINVFYLKQPPSFFSSCQQHLIYILTASYTASNIGQPLQPFSCFLLSIPMFCAFPAHHNWWYLQHSAHKLSLGL